MIWACCMVLVEAITELLVMQSTLVGGLLHITKRYLSNLKEGFEQHLVVWHIYRHD